MNLSESAPLPAAPEVAGSRPIHLPVTEGETCLEILSDRIRTTPGVVAIEASFKEGTVTVRYQPSLITPEELNELADDVGALFAQRVTTCERRASAESCEECALRLGHLPGGTPPEFEVLADPNRVAIARRHAPADALELKKPLPRSKPWGAKLSHAEQEHYAKGRSMAILTGTCLAALVTGMLLERSSLPPILHHAAYLTAAITGGWFALRSSLASLARGRLDVNLLMILAAVGAGVIGYLFEAAVLMFLFALSNTLEVYTMGRTRRALHALLKLRPARALVRRGQTEMLVDADDVQVGERVIVKPGESVPVDGLVLEGISAIDQSTLTGESVPVEKNPGDRVFAGTVNQQGVLEVRSTRPAGDTALARIVQLVRESEERKSQTEEVAEWAGRYYTVAVVVAAALMIVIPPFVLGQDFTTAFYRAMTLLVVASPCALVIATPATILSAVANAARNGVLFKGGRFVEALGKVRAIAFDKTGTLTYGRFEVTDVVPVDGSDANAILAAAASAEKRSQHPIAQAVVRAAESRGLSFAPAKQLTSHPGKGLVATLDDGSVEIGNAGLFEQLGLATPPAAIEAAKRLAREARTPMIVHHRGAWGVIGAADQVRPTSVGVIERLRGLGVRKVALLSGDSPSTVEAIAKVTKVDVHHGALLPEDKVRVIADLERENGSVAMVGDGVNDAPALARATIGIAMGGIGSDAAMESADVVLMGDDLTALPYAVHLSRRARGIVIANVAIATGVMTVLVLLVFFGHLTPFGALRLPVAVSGHEGSTVVVILNGLRLLGEKRS